MRVYEATLEAESSKLSMRGALRRAARLMGAQDESAVEWGALRFGHVEILKERLKRRGYQPTTTNATLAHVKGVCREAWRLGEMSVEDYQRIASVRRLRGKRDRSGRALNQEELLALVRACERDPSSAGERDAALVALMAVGGLRREECVKAQLSDFRRREHSLKVHGKGDRERTITFNDGGARRALNSWLRVRGERAGALLYPVDKSGRIVRRGMSGPAVYKALKKRAREAGLTRAVTPHDLRRTFATLLLDRGADLSQVKRLLGHASVETTTLYDRRDERSAQKALSLLSLPYRQPRASRARKRKRASR